MVVQLSYFSIRSLPAQARTPGLDSSWMPAFHSISHLTMSSFPAEAIYWKSELVGGIILAGVLVHSHSPLFSHWCRSRRWRRRKPIHPYHHNCHPSHCCGHTAVCMCVRNLLYIPTQVERSELTELVGSIIILHLYVKTCVIIWKTVCQRQCQSLFHHTCTLDCS